MSKNLHFNIKTATLFLYHYHHVDNGPTSSVLRVNDLEPDWTPCLKDDAARLFRYVGWEGDGEIILGYLPPFGWGDDSFGVYYWSVKQSNNGTTFICSNRSLANLSDELAESEVKIDMFDRISYDPSGHAYIDAESMSRENWRLEE